MKKKLKRLFACIVFGVMLFAMTSSAYGYDNVHYCINCTLSCYSKYATAATDGAQSYGSECYNRALVYTRKSNGATLERIYALKKQTASATTGKSSNVSYATSYHFVADSRGNSLEPLYRQVQRVKHKY